MLVLSRKMRQRIAIQVHGQLIFVSVQRAKVSEHGGLDFVFGVDADPAVVQVDREEVYERKKAGIPPPKE
jgi:sRNA-binding carbon storage regulator CsrA